MNELVRAVGFVSKQRQGKNEKPSSETTDPRAEHLQVLNNFDFSSLVYSAPKATKKNPSNAINFVDFAEIAVPGLLPNFQDTELGVDLQVTVNTLMSLE